MTRPLPILLRMLLGVAALATFAATASAQPWVARHGLSSSGYQSEFNQWVAKGYRLTHVSGYTEGGQDRYAAIWEKRGGPAWIARHGMSSAGYQSEFNQWVAKGYRLTHVSGYAVGGQDRYAAIWEQRSGPAWVARHGLTSEAYQAETDKLVAKGYRIVHVDGYTLGGQDRYAAIWEQRSGPAWVARHRLSPADYQSQFTHWTKKGYRLAHVSGYRRGANDQYAAIWEKRGGPRWIARHGMSSSGYQAQVNQLVAKGYRITHVNGFGAGGNGRYAAIFEQR